MYFDHGSLHLTDKSTGSLLLVWGGRGGLTTHFPQNRGGGEEEEFSYVLLGKHHLRLVCRFMGELFCHPWHCQTFFHFGGWV